MKREKLFLSLLTIVLVANAAVAQVMTGTPPYQSFGGGPDVINLGNLNVHYSIPIVSRAGRGMPFSYALSYDSSVWTIVGSTWTPASSKWGLTRDTAASVGYVQMQSSQYCVNRDPGMRYAWSSYVDSAGTIHPFPPPIITETDTECIPGGKPSQTVQLADGSGLTVTVTSTPSATVTSKTGEVITPGINTSTAAGTQMDTNGNKIISSVNASVTTFYDTLSTTTPVLTIDATNPASVLYKYESSGNAGDRDCEL